MITVRLLTEFVQPYFLHNAKLIMKKLALAAALGFTSLLTAPLQAATATGTFTAVVNLTSACVVTNGANMVFNYTSLGVVQNPTTTLQVKSTNLLPFTLGLSSPSTSAGTTTVLGLA